MDKKIILALCIFCILLIGSIIFFKIYNTHKINTEIIAECYKEFEDKEQIVLTKNNIFSEITCE